MVTLYATPSLCSSSMTSSAVVIDADEAVGDEGNIVIVEDATKADRKSVV